MPGWNYAALTWSRHDGNDDVGDIEIDIHVDSNVNEYPARTETQSRLVDAVVPSKARGTS